MDREQEEAILRITAQYIEEVRAGHQPKLSDYLARYPQFAAEIADFVAYYHTVEVDLPGETSITSPLAGNLHIAIDPAWRSLLQPGATSTYKLATLLVTVNQQRLTLSQLADKVGLSVDIVAKLEQRKIAASSIPKEMYKRLAETLQQPMRAIEAYFESFNERSSYRQQVAEAQVAYQVNELPAIPVQSFREALEESVQLSGEQKHVWFDVLNHEGL
jgi:transcriptional regulator with XRE-family HTH domain